MAQRRSKQLPKRLTEPLRLIFDTDAHAAMETHCSASAGNEVCGVLVGFTGEEAGLRWTRVVAVIEGRHAREDQMSVTFTHETWDAVHAKLAERDDKARVIGWYHTHPDFGIFYSAPDVFVHRNFFGLEGQVGVVVDPVRAERGVFASTSRGLQTLSRYEVARQNKAGHFMRCTYQTDPLRDAAVEARAASESQNDGFARSSLDSIEAGIARVERRVDMVFRMLLLAVPLAALISLLLGLYLGRRVLVVEIPRGDLKAGAGPIVIPIIEDPRAKSEEKRPAASGEESLPPNAKSEETKP